MGLSDDGDEDRTRERFDELCSDLNMDLDAKTDAWQSYTRIIANYTLEGDRLHWLTCSLYFSCRSGVTPTVKSGGHIEGNCVSLTRLLRSSKLSLIEFFKKMKKWADMASLPQEFRDKIERLERNFAVSMVTFKKFEPIFLDIFENPAGDPPRPPKSRKQKRVPCTATDIFNFCWTMFVLVKGHFPAISDDLVNSYHLLLCCLDWIYYNTLISDRRDLLNHSFSGLPSNFNHHDYKPPAEIPCIVYLLCQRHEGLEMEAKEIKEFWWKPYIRKLFDKKLLHGKAEQLTGVIELCNFDANSKEINAKYETYVLNVGDFDERIFLGDDSTVEIGTPAKGSLASAYESSERLQITRNLLQNYHDSAVLVPLTPLTGRRYLREKEGLITPVSTATQSVSRLQLLLSSSKTYPTDMLLEVFSKCSRNPVDDIAKRVVEMGDVFCEKFAQPIENPSDSAVEFARRRLQLGENLYYKMLEKILVSEQQRIAAAVSSKTVDFSNLLEQDVFHRSLFAISLEIVIFSYNSQRVFPWIIEVFEISSYYFYKVIEVLVRVEDGLSRDVVKHLNHIEETILGSLAWRSDSPLWDAVNLCGNSLSVEEVSLPSQLERESSGASSADAAAVSSSLSTLSQNQKLSTPPVHRDIQRITANVNAARREFVPISNAAASPSAAERFSSPAAGTGAKRRLFDSGEGTASSSSSSRSSAGDGSSQTMPIPMVLVADKTGRQMLIPIQMGQSSPKKPAESNEPSVSAASKAATTTSNKPKRTGSLALFFRKVYHLASVRMRELCDRLEVDAELCSQTWTCFEHCLMQHTDLMKDRHLDQLIMCSVYVMAKVTGKDRSFQDIMRCYRLQPQAQSHIYRSVLLSSRHHKTEPTAQASSPMSAVKDERRTRRDKTSSGCGSSKATGSDSLSAIRSSSTLPIAEPSSEPPTPTRMAGAANTFQFEDRGEDRGDLIKFYNSVFVVKIKNFAVKFSVQNEAEKPPLSPLPVRRTHATSPRKVSNNHSVYVSPHKRTTASVITPQSRLLYCFNRSPARDLRTINNMLRGTSNGTNGGVIKRLPLNDDGALESPAKRSMTSGSPAVLARRLEKVMTERKATTGSN